jgi:hypothetical protein
MSKSPNTHSLMSKYQAQFTIEVHSLLDFATWFDEIHITEQQEISMEHCWTDDSWKRPNYLEKCHYVHHKSHTDCLYIETELTVRSQHLILSCWSWVKLNSLGLQPHINLLHQPLMIDEFGAFAERYKGVSVNSKWISFVLSPFAHIKRTTERYFQ